MLSRAGGRFRQKQLPWERLGQHDSTEYLENRCLNIILSADRKLVKTNKSGEGRRCTLRRKSHHSHK